MIKVSDSIYYSLESDRFYSKSIIDSCKSINKPLTICYHIGYKCNLSCDYCLAPVCYDNDNLNISEQDLLGPLRQWGILRVCISGGEPFLYPDKLKKVCSVLKNDSHIVIVCTNGTLMEDIISYQGLIDWVDISMPATNSTIYNAVRGTNMFDRVIKGIKRAQNVE